MELLGLLIHAILLMASPALGVISAVTSTKTEIVVQTVTNTLVAIGGVIQNVIVRLDNGNGHLWDYSTMMVTGEQVLTIIPSTHISCATIYVYGDVTLTSETTLITGPPAAKMTGLGKLLPPRQQEEIDSEQKEKINEIIERMVRSAADLSHIKVAEPKQPNDFDHVVAI